LLHAFCAAISRRHYRGGAPTHSGGAIRLMIARSQNRISWECIGLATIALEALTDYVRFG
jgi:hypothetical protein